MTESNFTNRNGTIDVALLQPGDRFRTAGGTVAIATKEIVEVEILGMKSKELVVHDAKTGERITISVRGRVWPLMKVL